MSNLLSYSSCVYGFNILFSLEIVNMETRGLEEDKFWVITSSISEGGLSESTLSKLSSPSITLL